MKRFIFDLDCTLLTGDYSGEEEYFKEVLGNDSRNFLDKLFPALLEYENSFFKYDVSTLSAFLTDTTGVNVTDEIVEGWIENNMLMDDYIEDGTIELLEYLKNNNKSIAVLTNWFSRLQIERLKKAGIYKYFDDIYCGDQFTKPHKEAYLNACGIYKPSECLMIGDSLDKDYIAPRGIGMDSVLYDKEDKYHKTLNKVKRLNEIIGRY
ncbi:MAG: HAD family hydrolase [Bacilli bacterium]|nr:HAD family hydrolase [Bacilli bacterium]